MDFSKSVSAYSLKSIGIKQEAQRTRAQIASEKKLGATPFTQEQFGQAWQHFLQKLQRAGRIIHWANLQNEPQCVENQIRIQVISETAKSEVLSIREELLGFLHQELDNHLVDMQVEINPTQIVQHYKTPEEKLQEIFNEYPLLSQLQSAFELMIE